MITALWSGATGMASQQVLLDAIANNLANINTTGFKKQRVEFQDLHYREVMVSDYSSAAVGHGSRVSATSRDFGQGNLEYVDDPFSMAIEGEGFFMVDTPKGTAYTRDGSFKVDAGGHLVTSTGYPVLGKSDIRIPFDAKEISVSPNGIVSAMRGGTYLELGRLNLAVFQNPQGLEALGQNLFRETQVSGEALIGSPMEEGFGGILERYLETSNVDLVSEMVNMIVAQRAFEMNSKTVQTADQMWGLANNLR